MFSLVVLSVVLAAVAAAPQPGLIGAPLAYSHIAPAAISHTSRVDVHSKPLVAIAAPVVHAAPFVHAAPLIAHSAVLPAAVSHSSRYDVHQSHPVLNLGYAGLGGYYGGHGLGYGGAYGLGHTGYSVGVGHGYGYGGYGHHGGYLGGHYW